MTGKYYEELEVGQVIHHKLGRTVTEMDNVMFCALTMNTQPLHLDADYSKHTLFGRRIVNGIYTLGLVVGLSVSELTEGTILANLGYEKVNHPNPLFHGDTIYVETEVLDKRPSRSRPECGLVHLRHIGRKADGTIVIEVERTAMFYRKERPAQTNEEPDARP